MISGTTRTLIVGLGSAHGDDQAGWLMAERLSESCRDRDDVVVRRALAPLDVLDWLDGIDVLHLCDACHVVPGSEHLLRFRWQAGRLVDAGHTEDGATPVTTSAFRSRGTHDFSVTAMLQLAEKIQSLPKCVTIWAIAGSRFQPGDSMSEETRHTTLQAVSHLLSSCSTSGNQPELACNP